MCVCMEARNQHVGTDRRLVVLYVQILTWDSSLAISTKYKKITYAYSISSTRRAQSRALGVEKLLELIKGKKVCNVHTCLWQKKETNKDRRYGDLYIMISEIQVCIFICISIYVQKESEYMCMCVCTYSPICGCKGRDTAHGPLFTGSY